ncbi:MAG: hypothetical protein M3258_01860 [Thermoproteota archaeon]|nr:hypothetical protein [Thermoproteota archaeon]
MSRTWLVNDPANNVDAQIWILIDQEKRGMQYMVVSKRHVINAAVLSANNPRYNLKASCGAAGSVVVPEAAANVS